MRHWFHLAYRNSRPLAVRAMPGHRLGIAPARQPIGPPPCDPARWFDRELGNLIDGLRHSLDKGWTRLAAGILTALTPYLYNRYLIDVWRECLAAQDRFEDAADIYRTLDAPRALEELLAEIARLSRQNPATTEP